MADAAFNTGTRSQPLGDPKAGLSADLDALAAYVASLNEFARSPYRTSSGALTTEAQAGRAVFKRENCAACHTGAAFSDSSTNVLRNIGTLKPTSGQRLGGPLTGIDTPTLRSVWQTAPYLHDGSAATIAAAISAHSGVSLSASDLSALAAYVAQTDGSEATAPVNAAPVVIKPANQTSIIGKSVSSADRCERCRRRCVDLQRVESAGGPLDQRLDGYDLGQADDREHEDRHGHRVRREG